MRIRAKKPRGSKASENSYVLAYSKVDSTFAKASADFRFATAVMATAEVLRRSKHAATWKLADITRIAKAASDADNAERQEFLRLLDKIKPLHIASK